jgi:hypothetical protein
MAGFFQEFIKGAEQGFFGTPYLRDAQHASKIFRTNGYGNAPHLKYLFHVYFEVHPDLIASGAFPNPEMPGILVKNITLPKYNVNLSEMNQYNRKRYVQTKINYDPVSVTFHDDNLGAVSKLWQNFYSYYYNDTFTASSNQAIGQRNTYSPDNSAIQNWGYLGEPATIAGASTTQPKTSFFKNVYIYGFNQHNFRLYTLVNPTIERFEHDTYDYSAGNGVMENKMTLRYEAVTYKEDALNGQKPDEKVKGFGLEATYDRTLSPISRPGSNKSIMGPGGLVDATDSLIDDISSGNYLRALQTAGTTAKTFKGANLGDLAKRDAQTALLGGAAAAGAALSKAARGVTKSPS